MCVGQNMKENFNHSDALGYCTLDAFELKVMYVCLHFRVYIFVLYICIGTCIYIYICTYIYIYNIYIYDHINVCGVQHEADFQ